MKKARVNHDATMRRLNLANPPPPKAKKVVPTKTSAAESTSPIR